MRFSRPIACLFIAFSLCLPALAGAFPLGSAHDETVFWTGVSFNSPDNVFLGRTPGRDFHLMGIGILWNLVETPFVGIRYKIDLIPAAIITDDATYGATDADLGGLQQRASGHDTKIGLGVTPIGLRIDAVPQSLYGELIA